MIVWGPGMLSDVIVNRCSACHLGSPVVPSDESAKCMGYCDEWYNALPGFGRELAMMSMRLGYEV